MYISKQDVRCRRDQKHGELFRKSGTKYNVIKMAAMMILYRQTFVKEIKLVNADISIYWIYYTVYVSKRSCIKAEIQIQ
jgi:hypothetical protein